MTVSLPLDRPAADPANWFLDPCVTYLNHGAFGACPREVLSYQSELRERLEREPVDFFVRDLEDLMDHARGALAAFLGADEQDIVPVSNATAGINAVLRSLRFEPGDEFLVTNHEYNASRNALDYAAAASGANVVVARVPFPISSEDQIIEAIRAAITSRTRLALVDHVTSQTGLVFPLERIIELFHERGIEVLVDGAHAPGMLPLDLSRLGATYYSGNCHKWLCAPKGAGFLYVERSRQGQIRPPVISHGANSPRKDRSRFLIEFCWTGTSDPSAFLTIPRALEFLPSLVPGGWPAIMKRNHDLVVEGRQILCRALGIEEPSPREMLGSLAAVPLPDSLTIQPSRSPLYLDSLQDTLRQERGIEVPIIPWPAPPSRLLRISAQLYNSQPQYENLADSLVAALKAERQTSG